MSHNVFINRIKKLISDLYATNDTLVVLKGIPISLVDSSIERIHLEDAVSNKLGYFMSICGKRRILCYEEFLLLSAFIVEQYKEIYILDNNVYLEQYPVEECFSETVRKGLLTHFSESDEDEADSRFIGDIGEYIAIFEGIKEYNGYLMGAYFPIPALNNPKVITIPLFENKREELVYKGTQEAVIDIDIIEEADYIDFIKQLFNEPDELNVRISNYTGDVNRLRDHLAIATYYWKDYTDVFCIQAKEPTDSYTHRDEYSQILNYYWGYPSFRTLPVYDMNKLERGDKSIVHVSQESIIANLVEEVENCGESRDFRDVFVTAPTGAGKSVMYQVPAIYLAEKYNLLTIVISPLIGLMNDQVKTLELKNYKHAKTINSDISPIVKQDIISKVSEGEYHILYISPETLLSRSDVEQLIGDRTIGMIVIDEAHIVTTWGKQFRPDYWYLGDHIRKLRKQQMDKKGRSFVIATFTATAIYGGLEDMYTETINSLHMLNPITYLGYVKRKDIDIVIKKQQKEKGERAEYELDKFDQIESVLRRAILTNKKTLVYFPTVALIQRCYEYLQSKREVGQVAIYHGSLNRDEKQENYEKFRAKEKLMMLATKAFGMGIDINDIEIIVHFAPTGNVCDYVQEIGRAARREDLHGEALYYYNSRDFKHINRLHGMSMIQEYQLIRVIEKIYELYQKNMRTDRRFDLTKKRNAMLLDAENFGYIFNSPVSDEDNNINKVKTALLLIQKDFEAKIGFSPITVRTIPLFSIGYFQIESPVQMQLLHRYADSIQEIDHDKHICRVQLNIIWAKDYREFSFPMFKHLLYTKDSEKLDFVAKYPMEAAMCVSIAFNRDCNSVFKNVWDTLKGFIGEKVITGKHTAIEEIVDVLVSNCRMGRYKAQSVCEVIIASMDSYRKKFAKFTTPIALEKTTTEGKTKYQFFVAVNSYFRWVESGLRTIENETREGHLYLINNGETRIQEYSVFLGILEAIDVLSFEMVGGANSQLYIYINQIQSLKNIINAPYKYENRLLNMVSNRHQISVRMLTYLYENDFANEERWEILENYFLGIVPEKVKSECRKLGIVF